jgi:hypothetical protein
MNAETNHKSYPNLMRYVFAIVALLAPVAYQTTLLIEVRTEVAVLNKKLEYVEKSNAKIDELDRQFQEVNTQLKILKNDFSNHITKR